MADRFNRLPAVALRQAGVGMHADGGGLYLQVTSKEARSWIFRYTLRGVSREMGLGSAFTFGLSDARERARECRQLCADGIDPIAARDARMALQLAEAAKGETFARCASAYIEAHQAGWRNAKHAAQWRATLRTYVEPVIGALPVSAVSTGMVVKILEPMWAKKPETANRVRGRIEAILSWATVRGFRVGDNPARWKGHLDKLLPSRAEVRRVEHHPALPYDQLPAFLQEVRQQKGTAARTLEFLILTAARTGEVIGARESEVSRRDKVWNVPGERMKSGKAHRVPLSRGALALLADHADKPDAFLFPGAKRGEPLSNMAMLELLKRMGRGDLTVHGFRSTFRDWAAERTNYPNHVVEMALAHSVGDKVEAAYRRGDLFEKRRRLMDEWARYCASTSQKAAHAVPIHAR